MRKQASGYGRRGHKTKHDPSGATNEEWDLIAPANRRERRQTSSIPEMIRAQHYTARSGCGYVMAPGSVWLKVR